MTLAMLQAALLIGVGATVIMDLWGILLRRLGIATLNFAMVGRWVGHLLRGARTASGNCQGRTGGERADLGVVDPLWDWRVVCGSAGSSGRRGLVERADGVACIGVGCGDGGGAAVLHAAIDGGRVLCRQDAEALA